MKRVIIGILGVFVFLLILFTFIFFNKSKSLNLKLDVPLLKKAEKVLLEGNYLEARDLYKKAKENIKDSNKMNEIQKIIEDLNIKILFSPLIDECSIKYKVKPGDSLAKIAKEFNTTVELIKRSNGLKSDLIVPNKELKINTCKFSVVVDKSQNLLFLKIKDEVIKTYICSTGKDNSTPVGNFKIVSKIPHPTWFKTGAVIPPDSPENILGSRWLGFDKKGYGIHGTTEPQNLGKQITLGCIRLKNEDVEELYDILPLGTEVLVVD